jgi:predicted nucleotidyltransferase
VLAALTRNTSSRTIRQLSLDAGVSWSRTSDVIDDLAELGIVERRQTPGGILVRLVSQNVAAKAISEMTDLRSPAVEAMREAARAIRPSPLSLTIFGSFARGTAGRDSDVDVVAVGADSALPDIGAWEDSLGWWVDAATAITGNPINLIIIDVDELAPAAGPSPIWLQEASEHGIVLAGQPLRGLMTSPPPRRGRA